MAELATAVDLLITDNAGKNCNYRFFVSPTDEPDDADIVAMVAAIDNLTAAKISDLTLQKTADTEVGTAASSEFDSAMDKLVLEFKDTAGGIHKVALPCPETDAFDSTTHETLDMSDTDLTDFIAMMETGAGGGTPMVGSNGEAVKFYRGYRSRHRSKVTK